MPLCVDSKPFYARKLVRLSRLCSHWKREKKRDTRGFCLLLVHDSSLLDYTERFNDACSAPCMLRARMKHQKRWEFNPWRSSEASSSLILKWALLWGDEITDSRGPPQPKSYLILGGLSVLQYSEFVPSKDLCLAYFLHLKYI